jgi:chromosome segregation ATPase
VLIGNAQREMNSNKERVGAYQAEIASHSEAALKDQLKILEKDLKDGQSEEKKNLKDIEKENDNVTRQEESIRQAGAEIVSIKNAQTANKEEISTQEEALKSLQATQAKYK